MKSSLISFDNSHGPAEMKKCPYCGAEYSDDATVCAIDQTPFEQELPPPTATPSATLQFLSGPAFTSGLGTFLINTAIYCAAGRVYLLIYNVLHSDYALPNVQEIMMMNTTMRWILNACFVVFTLMVCRKRCRTICQAIVVTVITMGIMILIQLAPLVMLAVPALFIGFITHSSAGYFIGSAFQIIAAALLLGWFNMAKLLRQHDGQ
jgi:hypothetical protein